MTNRKAKTVISIFLAIMCCVCFTPLSDTAQARTYDKKPHKVRWIKVNRRGNVTTVRWAKVKYAKKYKIMYQLGKGQDKVTKFRADTRKREFKVKDKRRVTFVRIASKRGRKVSKPKKWGREDKTPELRLTYGGVENPYDGNDAYLVFPEARYATKYKITFRVNYKRNVSNETVWKRQKEYTGDSVITQFPGYNVLRTDYKNRIGPCDYPTIGLDYRYYKVTITAYHGRKKSKTINVYNDTNFESNDTIGLNVNGLVKRLWTINNTTSDKRNAVISLLGEFDNIKDGDFCNAVNAELRGLDAIAYAEDLPLDDWCYDSLKRYVKELNVQPPKNNDEDSLQYDADTVDFFINLWDKLEGRYYRTNHIYYAVNKFLQKDLGYEAGISELPYYWKWSELDNYLPYL